MKHTILTAKATVFFFVMLVMGACTKKDDNTVVGENEGLVKITVHFTARQSGIYLKDGLKVSLVDKDGNTLAVQYTYGTGSTMDFGFYNYSDYTAKVEGGVYYNNGSGSQLDHNLDESQIFTLNSPTKTLLFEVQ